MAVIVTVIDVLSAILAKKYISIVNQLSAGLFVFLHMCLCQFCLTMLCGIMNHVFQRDL